MESINYHRKLHVDDVTQEGTENIPENMKYSQMSMKVSKRERSLIQAVKTSLINLKIATIACFQSLLFVILKNYKATNHAVYYINCILVTHYLSGTDTKCIQ